MFKLLKKVFENETKIKIKCLRSKNGGEFTSKDFEKLCEKTESKGNIQYLEFHNTMDLHRGKIGWFYKWKGQCYVTPK